MCHRKERLFFVNINLFKKLINVNIDFIILS